MKTTITACTALLLVAALAQARPPQCTLPDRTELANVWVVSDGRSYKSVTDLPARPPATACGKKNCDCGCADGENCRCASAGKSAKVTKRAGKSCCSSACTCGCNEGAPCTCGRATASHAPTNALTVSQSLPPSYQAQTGPAGCGEPCGGRAVSLACGSPWSASWGYTGTCPPVAPARTFVGYQAPLQAPPPAPALAFNRAPMMQAPMMRAPVQSFRPAMNFGGGTGGGFGGRSFGGGGGCST
jgi:hypothetical protein